MCSLAICKISIVSSIGPYVCPFSRMCNEYIKLMFFCFVLWLLGVIVPCSECMASLP
jgi:hypothetical protein